jgi:hypothetical protein
VGFLFTHVGGSHPAKFKVKCELFLGENKVTTLGEHYGGTMEWNLNPGHRFYGHTSLPIDSELKERLEIDTTITIIDRYGREHKWLPIGHVYDSKNNSWFAEPCPLVDRLSARV